MDEKLTPEELLAKVREKYPEYQEMDDKVALDKFLEKYPVYLEQVDWGINKDLTSDKEGNVKVNKLNLENEDIDFEKKTQEITPVIVSETYPELKKEREKLKSKTVAKNVFDDVSEATDKLKKLDERLKEPVPPDREIYLNEIKDISKRIKEKEEKDYQLGLNGNGILNDEEYKMLQLRKNNLEKAIENTEDQKILDRLTNDESITGRLGKTLFSQGVKSIFPVLNVVPNNMPENWYKKHIQDIEKVALSEDVEREVLKAVKKDTKLKDKILLGEGFANNQEKEKIIQSAKYKVFNTKYDGLKKEADKLIAEYKLLDKEDPKRLDLEKRLTELTDDADILAGVYNYDKIKGKVKNIFNSTIKSQEYEEGLKDNKSLDVVSSGVEAIGTGIINIFTSGASLAASIGDILTDDEHYSIFDALGDTANELNTYNLLPSSHQQSASLVNKDGSWNLTPYSISKSTATNLGNMLVLVAGLKNGDVRGVYKKIGGLIKNTKRAEQVISGLQMGERAFKMNYGQNYQQAKDLGLGSVKSLTFASSVSTLTGLVQIINPETEFFKTSFGKLAVKNLAQNLKKAGTRQAVKKTVMGFGKEVFSEMVEEEVEGGLQEAVTLALVNDYSTPFKTSKYHKELLAGTLFATSAFAGAGLKSNYKATKTEFYHDLAKNNLKLNDEIDKILSETKDERLIKGLKESKQFIGDVTEAINKSPEGVTQQQVDLLIQKKHLINEMKTKDEAFHPEYREKIEKINQKIRDLQGTGKSTQSFFSDVVKGTNEKYKPSKPYDYEMNFSDDEKSFANDFDKHKGEFDEHIATSIPTFRDIQVKKGNAIVKTFGEGATMIDLGGSEGGFVKTITKKSNGKIKTINLDANKDMGDAHNKIPVEGSSFEFGAFQQGWDDVPTHRPKEKVDIVHESMTFQFINDSRSDKIEEVVKHYLKSDGVFITEEKFRFPEDVYAKNEEIKNTKHKSKYYTDKQLSQKADEVLVGMKDNQADYNEYIKELKKHFKYVQEYWSAGNFKGIIATNNKSKFDSFLNNIGDTSNEYNYEPNKKPDGEKNKISKETGRDSSIIENDGRIKRDDKKEEYHEGVVVDTKTREIKFKDKNSLINFLKTAKNWAMFTAENPDNKSLSPEENKARNEELEKWLQDNGYAYKKIKGKYDNEENSFLVLGVNKEQAKQIAQKFGQESVAHSDALVYNDGKFQPRKAGVKTGKFDNNYSIFDINGEKVKVQINYDGKKYNEGDVPVLHKVINKVDAFIDYLKDMDDLLKNFGKGNLSSTFIPIPVLRGAIKVMQASAKTAKSGFELLSIGMKHITDTKWYKNLSKEDKSKLHKEGLEKEFIKMEKSLKGTNKNTSPIKKEIRKITGQVDTSKKVSTTESKLLKEKFKNLQRGFKTGKKEVNKLHQEFVQEVKRSLKHIKGDIGKKEINSILTKLSKLNENNISDIQKDVDRIVEIIETKKIRSGINGLKKRLKKLSKSNFYPVKLRDIANKASKINPKHLSKSQLAHYYNILNDIKNAMSPVTSKNYKAVNTDSLYDELDIIADRAEKNREKIISDEINGDEKLWGTDEEFENFVKSLNEEKKAKLKEKLINLAYKYGSKIQNIKFENSDLNLLKNVDFTKFDEKFLRDYIRLVDNIAENNDLTGANKIISKIKAKNSLKELFERVPIKKITNIKQSAINELKSLSMLFKTIFGRAKYSSVFNYLSGLSDIGKSFQSYKNRYNKYENDYFDLMKRLLKKNKNLKSAESNLFRGIVGQLIQGSTDEDMKINKSRIEQQIGRLRKYKDKSVLKMADKMEEIYKSLIAHETQEGILNHVKSLNDGNFEIINHWLNIFESLKNEFKDNVEYVHGLKMPEFIDFYLPIKTKMDTNVEVASDDSELPAFMQNGIGNGSPASASKERTKSPKLPKNRELDLDFDKAMLSKLSEMLQDIEMSKHKQYLKAFFDELTNSGYFGKETSDILIERINGMLDYYSGKPIKRTQVEKVVRDIESIVRKIGVKGALGTITQYPKQYISVAVNSAFRLGKNAPLLFREMFKDHSDIPLLEKYSINSRGETVGGTKYKSNRIQDYTDGYYTKISKKIGEKLKFIDEKADKIVFASLVKGDVNIARTTWVTFYKSYLKDHGVDISKIDMKTEHLKMDKIREEAASHAETMVEETQVASDTGRASEFFNGDKSTTALILRSLIMPYQRFNVNGKMRLIVDTQNLLKARKLNDKELLNESVKSLLGTISEITMFQGLKIYLLSTVMDAGKDVLAEALGLQPSDDDEDEKYEFKKKKFISNTLKDLVPVAIGSSMEDLTVESMNWIAYLQDENNDDYDDYFDWEKSKMKDNDLPFYKYGNKAGFSVGLNLGLYQEPIDRLLGLQDDFKYAFDDEPKVRNKWGVKQKFDFTPEQKNLMKITFFAEATSFIGMEMETMRALKKLQKEALKEAKVKKKKGKNKKSVFF